MKRIAVSSSCLRAIGYDADAEVLEVEFQNGSRYRYERVPAETVAELLAADSLGRYFNLVFKARNFPYRRLD